MYVNNKTGYLNAILGSPFIVLCHKGMIKHLCYNCFVIFQFPHIPDTFYILWFVFLPRGFIKIIITYKLRVWNIKEKYTVRCQTISCIFGFLKYPARNASNGR